MGIVRIPTEDVIASIEKYATDAWPDATIKKAPTAHEAFDTSADTLGNAWAAFQWLSFTEEEPNRNGVLNFDFRIVAFSREADRLAATKRADQFVAIFNNVSVTIYDRSDGGTTAVAKARLDTAVASPPTIDDRGIRLSVLDVSGTVYPD